MAKADEAKTIVITESRVAEMIAAAVKELVTEKRLLFLLEGTVTVEQAKDLFNEAFSGMIDTGGLQPLAATPEVVTPELDPDWLAGLTFQGAKREVIKEKGQRPRAVTKPFSRPLAPEDVLSFSVGEDAVTLVTADGKKHTVEL